MDKNKVIQVATKHVQKGNLDRAIAEYGKLLKEDPRDVRILLKVGELQQKKGDVATAARTLLQVAETYSSDGFFLKAVAVFKQVLKLDPGQTDIHLKLAELYQQLGLMQDALAQYGLVAANHEKAGNVAAAIEAIRRLVDLAPDNLAGRTKLAELFAKEGRNGEAVQEFRRAAEALEKAFTLLPGEPVIAEHLADAYLKLARTREAIDLYRRALEILERSPDPKVRASVEAKLRALSEPGSTRPESGASAAPR